MKKQDDKKTLRSFGLILGGMFTVIGVWPILFRHEPPRWWLLIPAILLGLLALVWPFSLMPLHRVWMKLGHVLGWVNTRILLGLGFFGIFTPIGWILRGLGKDPLHRKFDSNMASYRVNRSSKPGSHIRNPY